MIITGIKILLALFFILASSIKILGWQKKVFEIQLEFFKSYGLNRHIMFLVGLVELFGALLILSPEPLISLTGSLALFFTSIGAIFFHLRFDTFKDAIPAVVTLTLSGIVLGHYLMLI